jgi:hypothetical protein
MVAYGGIWLMVDEAHVTTFAVHPRYRRRRIGERLLLSLMDLAADRHAREATLEVRLSNLAARRLYEKYGFRPVGIRPRYYSDNQEDALIMTTEPLAEPSMTERIARLRAELDAAPPPDAEPDDRDAPGTGVHSARTGQGWGMSGPLLLAVESCATDRIALSRTAGASTPTSWPARSRSTRRPAASCPRSPPVPTCAGSCRCSTRPSRRPASRRATWTPSR